ncbi:thymidylate synthase, flavin-dependent [uncultured phage cr44_1]|jgi:thymidylate synthase (FAD)|uniref:Thymidylate synthase, flavin-dependent n=1 Tax=uncultured phage cr44_1 TaxID=2986405 RepID=A0AAE7V411_9CAUD|nr:thymidylate synthase, flavin-dependent [uncultured phage cr44_1]QWM89893.1 thymidylate synthase, flavin-dependent [uncultured phage cr44_1]
MKLIKPSFEIWNQPAGLEGVYKQIERVGRVCYKSEDKITEDSAKPFVDRMIKSGHGAMLEHGTVYLKCETEVINRYIHPEDGEEEDFNKLEKYEYNSYSVTNDDGIYLYVTTNLRVLVENDWLDDLQYICEPTEYHEKRITVHFVCDRGVSHEFVRHRVMSFAQESTRYCNYSKDKFGNELTFIQPCWLDDERLKLYGPYHTVIRDKSLESIFIASLNNAEKDYIDLIDLGWKPQEARAVLPNSLKTELVVTGFVSDWNHFFDLRARGTTGAPHPQAKELAEPLMKEFIARKYINN